jgi:medium-chain acyl-[acyl-carrier-protein] hydrolase
MERIHRELFKIKFYDTDFTNNVRLYSIINYMQETSEQHSNAIGIGYKEFIKEGLFWVVSRIEVTMIKYPKNMDNVIIETWPSGVDKVFFKRNFRILDEKQQVIGNILAYYLLLDKNSKFPQRSSRLPVQVESFEKRFGEDKKLDKIKMVGELINTSERNVTYSDIDLNIHVNNAKYISWVEDIFKLEEYSNKRIGNLQLNFVKEAKYGDVVIINKYNDKSSPNVYYIEGVDKETGIQFFQCRVEFTSQKG